MKHLLVIFFICMGITAWYGESPAENWGNWKKWEKSPKVQPVSETEKRYCSTDQEEELLELLEELKDPGLMKKAQRDESEVRRKYRIARKLRQFDDCRAEDALKVLVQENACEDLGEGEIFCVAWGASSSLQEVSSKKDLKKLTPETPLTEQLKIFKKYGPHPHQNDFASHAVMQFLIDQADANPKVYVPLLVEYFTSCHEILPIVRNYPEETTIGLKKCFYGADSTVVWAGINLARLLGKVELSPLVYNIAFNKEGHLDYSQHGDIEEIQTMAIGLFRLDEKAALPYYRGILFGDFPKSQEYVISGIKDLNNPNLLGLLKEFSSHLHRRPEITTSFLWERVQKKIAQMEDAQK